MRDIQRIAAGIVGQVSGGRNLNMALNAALKKHSFTTQQRGALQDVTFGVFRYYGQLNEILRALLARPLKQKIIQDLLLVALYQLQYTHAAQHAVVDNAVQAARFLTPAASGLVNAVLRNFLRKQPELLLKAQQSDVGRYSYPIWWIELLREQYPDKAEQILKAGNDHPPLTLRVNQRKCTTEDYLNELHQAKIEARIIGEDAIVLNLPVAVNSLPNFGEGYVSVQDAGAQYAARLLDVHPGMRVLDACSAPGGKASHLLELADIELLAIDKDEQRLQKVKENFNRLQLTANVKVADASETQAWWDGKLFDRILADVPCSASGVVKRHPDIKWLRRLEDIEGFSNQQIKILNALWPLLKPGGKLLYATCSVFVQENKGTVAKFLHETPAATQLQLQRADMMDGQLLPNDEHDGFFYALLQKTTG